MALVIIFGGYLGYKKMKSTTGETRYVTALVEKGTIISSVSGTGQVSASSQIDIKPEVSGTITGIYVNPGDSVQEGKLLFSIDSTDAQKAVRDAEINLQNANLSLQKLQIQNSDTNLNTDLAKAYDDGFNTVSNTFLDLPGIMNGLNTMFFTSTVSQSTGQWNINWYEGQVIAEDADAVKIYKQNLIDSYDAALKAYNDNFDSYKSASRTSDNATIEALISKTYDTVKLISTAIKNANNYIDFVNSSIQKRSPNNTPAIITTHKATLSDYTSKTNTDLSNLLTIKTNITSSKDAFPNSNIDIQSAELAVKQKENALSDAKQNLSYYYVRAPFSGVMASIPVIKGDNASPGTTLGSIITSKKVAVISLNEVDVAKISLGEKGTLSFDAIPLLSISGKVVEVDSIGTVSQGVVNYNVKISFDTDDTRIKPGMSATADIITNVKQDVLTVPNSAIKKSGNISYVEMFSSPLPASTDGLQGTPSSIAPINQDVEVGASNDTLSEIISGLKEGDQIVVKTIVSSSSSSTAPSLINAVGGSGRNNAARVLR